MNFLLMNEKVKSKYALTVQELFKGSNFDIAPELWNLEINGMTDDSRKVNPGDLFVAVPGTSSDGRRFISEAASLGAAAILTAPGMTLQTALPVIFVDNPRITSARLASRFYGNPSARMDVAGVTGTNGKTTVTYLLAAIFGSVGRRWGRIGTVGYDLGDQLLPSSNTTPGPIDLQRFFATMLDKGLTGCAMEVSSHALHQARCEAVSFASATFTNLSQDHLDYHRDMDDYFAAKALLFQKAPVSIVNIDDEYGRRLLEHNHNRMFTYSAQDSADLRYTCHQADMHGSHLEFERQGRRIGFDFPLPGWFNQQNAAAAAATALALGLTLEQVVDGLKCAPPVPGRLQPVKMGQPFAVYVDYAHSPDAIEKLLSSVRQFQPRNLRIVFGCGGDRDKTKRPIMGAVASKLADSVYITSDNPRSEQPAAIIKDIVKGITDKKKCQVIEDRAQAIKAAIAAAKAGDIVVIAGKGHEDYQVIGAVKKYFSDYEVARAVLSRLGYANNE